MYIACDSDYDVETIDEYVANVLIDSVFGDLKDYIRWQGLRYNYVIK